MEKEIQCKDGHKDEPRMVCNKCGAILCSYCIPPHIVQYEHQLFLMPFSAFVSEKIQNLPSYLSAADALEQFSSSVKSVIQPILLSSVPEDDYLLALKQAKEVMSERQITFTKAKAKFMSLASGILQNSQQILKKRHILLEELLPKTKQLVENKNYYDACLSMMQIETMSKTYDEEEAKLQEQAVNLNNDDPRKIPIKRIVVKTSDRLKEESENRLKKVDELFKKTNDQIAELTKKYLDLGVFLTEVKEKLSGLTVLYQNLSKDSNQKLTSIKQKKMVENPSWFIHHFDEGSPQQLHLFDLERNFYKVATIPYPNIIKRLIASAQQDDNVYISGGYDGKQFLTTMMECKICPDLTVKPKLLANMSVGKDCHALVSMSNTKGKFVYSLGGYNGSRLTTCEKYYVQKNSWESTHSLPLSWCSFGGVCTAEHKYIYVFDGSLSHKDVCFLNTEDVNGGWEILMFKNPAGWNFASWGGAVQIGAEEILVFLQSNKSFIFDTHKNSFIQKYELSESDRFIQSYPIIYNQEVYTVGLESKDLFVFSTTTRQWRMVPKSVWMK